MEYRSEPLKTRVLILADGKSKEQHMGIERHLVKVDGIPLIGRTIRQFKAAGGMPHVITRNPQIRWVSRLNGAMTIVGSDRSEAFDGIDMIRKGLDHSRTMRSIIVFGDVVFTDDAVRRIMEHKPEGWAVYGRSASSKYGGSDWAEYFAISVGPLAKKQGYQAIETVVETFKKRMWHRITAWEWYYAMEGMPWNIHNARKVRTGRHWVEINDRTDDIDFESDVERFV